MPQLTLQRLMCTLNKAFAIDVTLDLSHWSKSVSPKCWTNLLCLVVSTEIWKSVFIYVTQTIKGTRMLKRLAMFKITFYPPLSEVKGINRCRMWACASVCVCLSALSRLNRHTMTCNECFNVFEARILTKRARPGRAVNAQAFSLAYEKASNRIKQVPHSKK